MAKDKITEYDATAANNTVIGDVNTSETMLPSQVNDAIREQMSHLKEALGSGTPLYVDQTNDRVGIGTASPSEGIHLSRSNATALIESTDGTQATLDLKNTEGHFIIGSNAGSLFVYDQTDGAERMRIDTSGNLLVGKTSTASNVVGAFMLNSGLIRSDVDGGVANVMNRKTSDGDIAIFQKDGGNVGSIGAKSGDVYMQGPTNHSGIQFNTNGILPFRNGALADNTLDVGHTNYRWQDLYLSGGINLTTTGAASAEITLKQSGTGGRDFRISSTGTGYGSAGNLIVYDATGSSERLRINSSGNVGIGTTSPASKLHSSVSGETSIARFQNTSGTMLDILSDTNRLYMRDASSSTDNAIILNTTDDAIEFRTNTSERMRIDSSGNIAIGNGAYIGTLSSTHAITVQGGAGAPGGSIRYGGGTGDNDLRFSTNGSERMRITSGGNVGIGTSSPPVGLSVQGNTGDKATVQIKQTATGGKDYRITSRSDGSLRFNDDTAGAERMRISNSGNVGIGTSSVAAKLHVESGSASVTPSVHADELLVEGSGHSGITIGSGTSSLGSLRFADSGGDSQGQISYNHSDNSLKINTNDSEAMKLDSLGRPFIVGAYTYTTAASANMFVSSSGQFFRSTSSNRYKNTINDATHGLTELLTLRPVTYKGDNDGDKIFGGLIAEEVHTAGLTEFVEYSQDDNGDDRPESIHYAPMVSLCIKAIQELKAKLDAAEARIATLEAN